MLINRIFCFIFVFSFANSLFAATRGFGGFAKDLVGPTEIVGNFIAYGCLVLGVMCIVASILRYFEYRRNPYTSTFSSVFMLFVLGLVLSILPVFYLLNAAKIFNFY